jgi:hypothetical protein
VNSRTLRVFFVKSLIVSGLCVINVASALGPGTVWFENPFLYGLSRVYLPSPANPGLVQIGNGPSERPAGTTDWAGWTPVSGSGFTAQLFVASGSNVPVDSLAPATPTTTFRTGDRAGFVQPVIVSIPGAPEGSFATVQMRVWDNQGGTVTDWATALAQPAGSELVGASPPINVGPLGGPGPLPPYLVGLQRFNLTYVPEPSPFALAWLGAFLVWFVWSKKRGSVPTRP